MKIDRVRNKAEEIPQWAKERVCELANAEHDREVWMPCDIEATPSMAVFARYIAQHEQPPVDPDEVAVNEILSAYHNNDRTVEMRKSDRYNSIGFARAVEKYKELKETKNEG